jgi:CNT family concentrative nucleoside transporter
VTASSRRPPRGVDPPPDTSTPPHTPAPLTVQRWEARDLTILGAALALAAVFALIARVGGVQRVQSFVGLVVIMAIAYAWSTNRRAIHLPTVAWGLSLQFLFALIVLKTEAGRWTFQQLGALVTRLLTFSEVGAAFVFGPLGDKTAWSKVLEPAFGPSAAGMGVVFAFQVLPTIIFIAALFAILYYYGVMQLIVRVFAVGMKRVMRASGAETLNVAASIFMGQTEAPLTIRPYLPTMTQSELMTVMTAGMAHISGGIMAAYILFGIRAEHLLTAVIMTAPGTLMMAKIFVPETGNPETMGTVKLEVERTDVNVIDAAGRGTGEGLQLALNVGAMLISFLALVALINALLGALGGALADPLGLAWLRGLSLGMILGWVFAPVAWAIGVPSQDMFTIGGLLGTRMALNEFVAYSQLGQLKDSLDPRSFTIATFALCGFANFSSIGIQIGGIGALAPTRRHDLARLGIRAMIAGTLANFVTATIAGFLL